MHRRLSDYLDLVLADVIENAGDFKRSDEETRHRLHGSPDPGAATAEAAFRKYQVNVLVDNRT